MPLVNTKEMFKDAYENHYAVGGFNVDSILMVQSVLKAANDTSSPVIIMISKGSREFMHPGNIKEQILCVSKDIKIPFAIHLDHGKSVEICKEVIDEGFTSVMFDAGDSDYETAIKLTREVVLYAHAHGATVEGELGPVKEFKNQDEKYLTFTNPALAEDFVKRTGVDSLAVSIGTEHGLFKFKDGEEKTLQFDIIKEIEERLPGFPLVTHGSSSMPKENMDRFNNYGGCLKGEGIPEELLTKAASMAVCKINIGTDFRVAYVGALRKSLTEIKDRFEPRNFLEPAKKACYEIVKDKIINEFKSANRIKI